jgi:hypothetical protein
MNNCIAQISDIDVNCCFLDDTPSYWDGYWNDNILGHTKKDPDIESKMLQQYHKVLYSRILPNGEKMELSIKENDGSLIWNNYRLSSDSITASFTYKNNKKMIECVSKDIPNWNEFIEDYLHKTYTIGGEMLFPKRKGGINQSRGMSYFIKDRWDLTLECIRRYYKGETSPLYHVLVKDKNFFDLFVDFKGYVEFFFLQDCVSDDYESVKIWHGLGDFKDNSLPKTVKDYFEWMDRQLEFVKKRNERIKDFLL